MGLIFKVSVAEIIDCFNMKFLKDIAVALPTPHSFLTDMGASRPTSSPGRMTTKPSGFLGRMRVLREIY